MGWPRHGMWAVIHVSQWVRLFSFHPRLSDHSLYNGLGARSNIVFLWHCKAQATSHCFLHFTKVGIWLWSGSDSGVHPYLERHLAHPRPSLHMHMHGLKQSKRCKTERSSHEGTSSAVTRLQDWTGWVWHETQASGCPSWVLSQFPAVLPHSLPVPHAFQKNGVSQRYSEDTRHHFTGITTETSVVLSPPVQITEIAMLFLHEVFYLEPSHD